jgi:hypothetical protein
MAGFGHNTPAKEVSTFRCSLIEVFCIIVHTFIDCFLLWLESGVESKEAVKPLSGITS